MEKRFKSFVQYLLVGLSVFLVSCEEEDDSVHSYDCHIEYSDVKTTFWEFDNHIYTNLHTAYNNDVFLFELNGAPNPGYRSKSKKKCIDSGYYKTRPIISLQFTTHSIPETGKRYKLSLMPLKEESAIEWMVDDEDYFGVMFADAPKIINASTGDEGEQRRYYADSISDGWVEFVTVELDGPRKRKENYVNDGGHYYMKMAFEFEFKVHMVPYEHDGAPRVENVRGWVKVNGYKEHEKLWDSAGTKGPIEICALSGFFFERIFYNPFYYEDKAK